MNFDLAGLIQTIALAAIPVTFAITLHEAAHGYAARHFGDYTAHNAGRISLNPLRHIDPVGTIAVPLLSTTLLLPGDELPLNDAQEIRARLERQVDLILDGGSCGVDMTTVIDLTGEAPDIVRVGKGSLEPFGVPA